MDLKYIRFIFKLETLNIQRNKECRILRECHQNYAHGPMKLKTEIVEIEYQGELFSCEKTVYTCSTCNFELQQQWMKDKMETLLENAYTEKHGKS